MIRLSNLIVAILRGSDNFYAIISAIPVILLLILNGEKLSPQNVFTTAALLGTSQSLANCFTAGVTFLNIFKPSLERIQSFLMEESHIINGSERCPADSEEKVVLLTDVTCNWNDSSSKGPLSNVTVNLHGNKLMFVTGPIGSGKSSLLHVIAGSMSVTSGKVLVKGKVGLSSQVPWIFSGTVRDNILFGNEFCPERYHKVIEACALKDDLDNFPQGDLTELGERGISLSGGQKARVSLARAVYFDADIYLLDDPLKAVDSKTGRHIFQQCIKRLLSDSMRILVTHQLQYASQADCILILESGKIVSEASYDEMKLQPYFESVLSEEKRTATVERRSRKLRYLM